MRFYGFRADEIANDAHPDLDLEIDPKLSWALRHPEAFPIDLQHADYETILRVPGIGVKSARLIVASRRHGSVTTATLKKMGVVMKKAQYFITCRELASSSVCDLRPENVRRLLLPTSRVKRGLEGQLSLF
jgi:predicted DNA-binding helix-hairpin-helix protein